MQQIVFIARPVTYIKISLRNLRADGLYDRIRRLPALGSQMSCFRMDRCAGIRMKRRK
jgi:hypothetical protein